MSGSPKYHDCGTLEDKDQVFYHFCDSLLTGVL